MAQWALQLLLLLLVGCVSVDGQGVASSATINNFLSRTDSALSAASRSNSLAWWCVFLHEGPQKILLCKRASCLTQLDHSETL